MDGLTISDIDAELARRGMPAPDAQQSASPHPSGLTLDDIDGELNRRGINPTAVPAPAHAAAGASGPMANLGAGINEGIASTVGAPVDAMTWALNQGAHGINALAGTTLPDIANPVGGSESIKSLMGVAGADPRQVQGGDDFERVMRGGGQGVGSMMMPYGAGRALIANGANGVLGAVGRAFGGAAPAEAGVGTLAAGAAGNAAIGGVGGALGAEGQALTPPDSPYAPLVDLAGNLVGGGTTAATMGLAKAGINYGVDQARNLIQPMRRAGQEEIVGARLRNAATDPAAVAAQGQPADLVAGSASTLYQLTGDSGIGQLERQQRTVNPQPFLDRAADQNASRVDALTGLAPEQANPNAVRDLFQQHLSALDQSGDAAVVNARTAAQQAFNAAGGQAPREDYGAAMRDQLEAAKAGAKAQEGQLWRAIDPNGSLKINGAPVTDAAKQIIAGMPETARPMEGEEAKVFQAAQFLGTASPFNNLSALRSRLLDAIREERQNGQTPALRRMQMLRSAIDDTMSGAAESVAQDQAKAVAAGTMSPDMTAQAQIARQAQGWYAGNNVAAPAAINRLAGGDFPGAGNGSIGNAPGGSSGVSSIPGDRGPSGRGFELSPGNSGIQGEAQPVANFDADAAARYRAAADATRARAQTFNTGAAGQILQAGPAGTPYRVAASQVPARTFSSPENIQSYLNAGGSPATLRDALVGDLRRSATAPDGSLDVSRYLSWVTRRADALQHFPDLRSRLADVATAQQTVDQTSGAAIQATRDFQQSAARHFFNAEPMQAVGAAFASKNPVKDFQQLAQQVARDPDAKAGLQRAVADYMREKFISNTEAGTSGLGTVKGDAFQTFVRKNSFALAYVFSPEQVQSIRDIAADLQRSNRSLYSTKVPGQSNTAQDLAAGGTSSVLSQYVSHAVPSLVGGVGGYLMGGMHGAVEGVLGVPAVKAAIDKLRRVGIERTDQLLTEALLNPELAQALLTKGSTGNAPFIAHRLGSQINALLAAQAARQSDARRE